MAAEEKRLRCVDGHSFDIARQGHVQLTSRPIRHPGDTAEMVDARQRVQQSGAFDFLTEALATAVSSLPGENGMILDVGAGTGHYLAALLKADPVRWGLALDSSKVAGRRAARAHPRVGSVVGDVTEGLCVRDSTVDVVLSVFAPRNVEEFARVLRPGGHVVVVTPRPEHLAEPRQALGLLEVAEGKVEALADSMNAGFDHTAASTAGAQRAMDATALTDLVMMGPNAFHQDPGGLATAIAALDLPVDVTLSVDLSVFRRR